MTATGAASPSIRRSLGWVVVAALCVAALTAIVALLTGSFDDTDWRIIGTSVGFGFYSALAGAGASVRPREHPAARPLGSFTIAAAAGGFLLLAGVLWADDGGGPDWAGQAWGCVTLVALAGSHSSLVVRARRSGDSAAVAGLAGASIVLVWLDCAFGVLAILEVLELDGEDDPLVRVLAVLVVLLLLTSALPPVLRRLAPARPASPPAAGPFGARQERFEQLAAEVIAASDRFERLDDLAEIRRESRRLRELAHRLKD